MKTISFPLFGGRTWSATFGADGSPVGFDLSAVTIRELAHGLARVNRFCGAPRQAYSVAEHSVLLAAWVGHSPHVCLLHDAPEALGVADCHGGLKKLIAQPVRAFEAWLSDALWTQLMGAPSGEWERLWAPLHQHDQLLGSWEASVFGFPNTFLADFDCGAELPGLPRCLPAETAEAEFLAAWEKTL